MTHTSGSRAAPSSDPALEQLHRQGFVNLGNLGIDVTALGAAAAKVFGRVVLQTDPMLNKINIRSPFMFHPTPMALPWRAARERPRARLPWGRRDL